MRDVRRIVGASFYGYLIGSITSLVAESDAHTKAYYDRMNIVTAWCDHHAFHRPLRRRVRRYPPEGEGPRKARARGKRRACSFVWGASSFNSYVTEDSDSDAQSVAKFEVCSVLEGVVGSV